METSSSVCTAVKTDCPLRITPEQLVQLWNDGVRCRSVRAALTLVELCEPPVPGLSQYFELLEGLETLSLPSG